MLEATQLISCRARVQMKITRSSVDSKPTRFPTWQSPDKTAWKSIMGRGTAQAKAKTFEVHGLFGGQLRVWWDSG